MRAPRLSIDAVWMTVAVAVPASATLLAPLWTVDLAYQVRTGDAIIAERALPTVDAFTFSAAGLPWTVQQWGAAAALAAGFAPAAWTGLLLLAAALVGGAAALVLVACRAMGATPRTAAVLALLAYLAAFGGLTLRAQLFGVLCFAATLGLVAGRERAPRLFLVTPLVLVVWANFHGSFPLGLMAVGWGLLEDVAARRELLRRDGVVLALSLLATCVTPFGPAVWLYAGNLAVNSTVGSLVAEWQSPTLRSVPGLILATSAAGVAAAMVFRRDRVTWPTVLWLGVLFVLALWTQRAVVWWALGAAVAVAGLLAAEAGTSSASRLDRMLSTPAGRRASVVNVVLVTAIVAAPIALALSVLARPANPVTGPPGLLRDAPPGVTSAVKAAAGPGDRILNPQRWGSWLLWAVPDALVFVDSRIEIVPRQTWDDYIAVSRGRFDWRTIVDRISPDLIVASRADQPALIDAIAADPSSGWREIYADDDGVVYSRRP